MELAAGNGIFRWSWRIWRWGRDIRVNQQDVTSVKARIKWYGNRLIITMNGKTYSLGGLLDEDPEIIVRELRRALPETRSAT
jgi:predicted RNA-binding protein with PUA domain